MFSNGKRIIFGVSTLTTFVMTLGIFLAVGSSLTGCTQWIEKDDRNEVQPIEVNLTKTECFKSIPQTMELYFHHELTSSTQIHSSFECIDQGISLFSQMTTSGSGTTSDTYQINELSRFFKTYLFKEGISDELAREIMKLKVGLVGGALGAITKGELGQIQILLPSLEVEMVKLYPHFKLLLSSQLITQISNNQVEKQNFELAIAELKKSMSKLLSLINLEHSGYSLNDLNQLLSQIIEMKSNSKAMKSSSQAITSNTNNDNANSESSNSSTEATSNSFNLVDWQKNILTLKKIRTLMAGESDEDHSKSYDIEAIYSVIIDLFRLGVLYQSEIKFMAWTQSKDFPFLDIWVNEAEDLLKRTIQFHASKEIPFGQIDSVLNELYQRGKGIPGVSLSAIKKFYPQFIFTFLSENKSPLSTTDSLKWSHVQNLSRIYHGFSMIQKTLLKVFSEKLKVAEDNDNSEIPEKQSVEIIREAIRQEISNYKNNETSLRSPQEIEFYSQAWEQFLTLITTKEIRHWQSDGKYSATLRQAHQDWSFQELSYLNIFRTAASLFMSSYGLSEPFASQSLPIDKKYLTSDQIRAFFKDFSEFGAQMSLFDLREKDTSERTLHEADLFTIPGNGDLKVQFLELFDLFASAWSGGVLGLTDLKAQAQNDACELNRTDYFNKAYLNKECVSLSFKKHFKQIFPNMPLFGTYIENMDQKEWGLFYKDLTEVSRVCPMDSVGLETGDQRKMLVILHFIENLFYVFDVNVDGKFSEAELEAAYPRFHSFFLKNSGTQWWPGLSQDAFKFVVFRGYKPSGSELIKFKLFTDNKGYADRHSIVKVFSALKSDLSTAVPGCFAQ